MSPTLLEFAVALVLLVVAWQLGVALAPGVFRKLRELWRDLDVSGDDVPSRDEDILQESLRKDRSNGTHR